MDNVLRENYLEMSAYNDYGIWNKAIICNPSGKINENQNYNNQDCLINDSYNYIL